MPGFASTTSAQNPYSDPSLIDTETDTSLSHSTLQQTSMRHLRTNDSAIAQREREINDIAKGIIELADIFKELQTMVIDQGTMLDRIDYNVENMNVHVQGAQKELTIVRVPLPPSQSITILTYMQEFNGRAMVTDSGFYTLGNRLPKKEYQAQNYLLPLSARRRHVHPFTRQTEETSQRFCTTAAAAAAVDETARTCEQG